jgi:hypothetical protein
MGSIEDSLDKATGHPGVFGEYHLIITMVLTNKSYFMVKFQSIV